MSDEFKSIRVSPRNSEESYSFTLYCKTTSLLERKSDLDEWIRKLADSEGMKAGYTISVEVASQAEATSNRSKLFEIYHSDAVEK